MQHDPADNAECSPGGSAPKYIMFPSATDGGLEEFSICSRRSIGATLEARSSSCFVPGTFIYIVYTSACFVTDVLAQCAHLHSDSNKFVIFCLSSYRAFWFRVW